MFSCEFCPLVLASKGSYFNHRKRKHQNEYLRSLQQNGKGFCCSLCKFSAPSNKDMIYHYNIVHEKGLKLLHEQFAMERDFAAWKENLQTETKTLYVQLKKTRQQMDYEVIYFGCNRSGKYVPKDDATHCTKSQGTSKFGGKCPVYMIKRTHLSSGLISVEYCSDHVGHDEEICHLRLSTKIRSKICGKLASGMEPKKVLDYIRDDHRKIDRDAMVTRKDIWNIRKRYHISNVEKHENDTQSVDIWIKELSTGNDFNPVVMYKQQGVTDCDLLKDDFVLCLQTEFQKHMLREFAQKMICIDSTHSTTKFLLTTIMVIDDFGEAIPTAWIISNREDAELLTRAFSALKHKCGDIMTDIFMSDLANNFYNAWTTVFTIPNKRLYCNWHVDKCWRRMIAKTISNLEDQATVYAYLKILHCETEEQKFRKMLQEVNDVLGETSPQFLEYFNNSYVLDDKYKLWASCFRIGSIANNNMYVEAFHRVLKSVDFSKKQYKGVDNLLMTLIKFSRDKCLEQFIKMPKGKSTHWVAEIQKRHRLVRTVTGVVSLGENEWKVENPTDHKYTVKKIEPQCLGKCQIKCSMCNVCVHMYTCTCPDFLMHAVACKHIHAIEISISGGKTFAFQQNRNKEPEVVIENTLVGTSIVRPQSLKANLHKYVDKIHEVIDLVDDEDCLKALGKRLVLGVAVAKGMRPTESFPRGTNMSSNKHFDTQKRFYSTQAKVGRKRKNRLKYPTSSESTELRAKLARITPQLCALCFMSDDRNDTAQVLWRQCEICDCWLHSTCYSNHDGCPICMS
nr:uncharacterized protein zf(c2h2/swim)-1 [Ciona intestinalis]|eukprot:XP_002123387.1 uncharacterized protein zf(c2h2/swim)-1 [Ciona intestinalis]